MDYLGEILVGTNAILFVVAGIYLKKYVSKKAEILATNENFEKLLEQTKQTAKATKHIEAKVNNSAWVEQQKWQIKKDFYIDVLEEFNVIKSAFSRYKKIRHDGILLKLDDPQLTDLVEQEEEVLGVISNSISKINSSVEVVGILFLDEDTIEAIRIFINAEERRKSKIVFEAAKQRDLKSLKSINEMTHSFEHYFTNLEEQFFRSSLLLKDASRRDLELCNMGRNELA